jgi:uncharacterized protein YcfL
MKYILSLGCLFFLVGCSTPTITPDSHNAVIPLGAREAGIFIPESWEKITPPTGGENIVLMARNGDENITISFEQSSERVTGNALCNGAEKGFSPFEQIFVDADNCFFSGHPAPNTPLRSFWQKIVRVPDENNFLLVSCSAEQQSAANSQCPAIIESFNILEQTN